MSSLNWLPSDGTQNADHALSGVVSAKHGLPAALEVRFKTAAKSYVAKAHAANSNADVRLLEVFGAEKKRLPAEHSLEKDELLAAFILIGFARLAVWCKGKTLDLRCVCML